MPSAEARRAEALLLIDTIERACAEAERAMSDLRWDDVGTALFDQQRVTHALSIALSALAESVTPDFRLEVDRRLRRVGAVRENQLARLRTYNEMIGARLQNVARFKNAARSLGSYRADSTLAALDQMQ